MTVMVHPEDEGLSESEQQLPKNCELAMMSVQFAVTCVVRGNRLFLVSRPWERTDGAVSRRKTNALHKMEKDIMLE